MKRRARAGLTIADFTTFCAAHQVRIATATYLQGTQPRARSVRHESARHVGGV